MSGSHDGIMHHSNADENPVKVAGVIQDITERKKAEYALKNSEEKYRQIVETSNEGIWALDSRM